ncbi:MAG: hypothetical protein HKM06_02980 [Spirochaetales bacterium]|nr:hypothetical protein [Spirochaetales bacterium]
MKIKTNRPAQPPATRFFANAAGIFLYLSTLFLNVSCFGSPLVNSRLFHAERLSEGLLVTLHPSGAPFPCSRRDEGFDADGVHYSFKKHYDDSTVEVFIPRGWTDRSALNLVFFFHGWYSSVQDSLSRFDLVSQFFHSRVNALLVVPETARDVPDSFGGKLESSGGFQTLVHQILARLAQEGLIHHQNLGRVILAGHSGAYHVIGEILRRGGLTSHIGEVILFDGLYGSLPYFEDWVDRRHGRFVSIFTEEGDAVSYSYAMIDDLVKRGIPLLLEKESDEKNPVPAGVRAVFYRSRRDHYDVVAQARQFQLLLQNSPLGHR